MLAQYSSYLRQIEILQGEGQVEIVQVISKYANISKQKPSPTDKIMISGRRVRKIFLNKVEIHG